MNKKKSYTDNGSRIKRILIQLPGYSYFHSTSENGKPNPNFIGRNEVKDKIISLISDSQTKSGSYLITGNRGVGKSSLLGEIINEFKGRNMNHNFIKSALIYVLMFLIVRLFDLDDSQNFILILLVLYLLLGIITFALHKDLKFFPGFPDWESIKSYFLNRNICYQSRFNYYNILVRISNALLMLILFELLKFENILQLLIPIIIVYLTISFFNIIKKILVIDSKIKQDNKTEHTIFYKYYKYLLSEVLHFPFSNYLRNRHKIFIRINLNHENLKEIDFFHMITRSVRDVYSNFYFYKLRFIKNLCIPIIVVISVSFFFYYKLEMNQFILPKYTVANELPQKTFLLEHFPTQYHCTYENDCLITTNEDTVRIYQISSNLLNKTFDAYTIKNVFGINKAKKIADYFSSVNIKRTYPELLITNINVDSIRIEGYRVTFNSVQSINPIYTDTLTEMSWWARLDLFVQKSYLAIRNRINNIPIIGILVPDGRGKYLDYGFVLFNLLLITIVLFALRFRFLGIITPYYIMRRLNFLYERTISTLEDKGSVSTKSKIFSFYRIKRYPKIDAKELEYELIELLSAASNSNFLFTQAEFIFFIDELDKISHNTLDIELEPNKVKKSLTIVEEKREKKKKLFSIFANLKFFLTTAEAKFIFIAGREMYDASMADVSSREFFMSSIFNQIINVDSFLGESHENISKYTESYVSRILLPECYKIKNAKSHYELNDYQKYLTQYKDETYKDCNEILFQVRTEKIISVLRHFVTYLTHVSGGSPKKIIRLIEEHIILKNPKKIKWENSKYMLVINRYRNCHLYLNFDFHSQYNFGLINYLVNPFFQSISNIYKDYGDKLLVSSTFIVNHMMKFHKSSFSWRIIEQAPDVLDINKTPELRGFFKYITQHLSSAHITTINNGLFDFKFTPRASAEISYLSKIKDNASAIFNFSLDSNQSVKELYRQQLDYLAKNGNESEKWYSIARIHDILGDLYYYDEEFHNSIIQYRHALGYLDKINGEHTASHGIVSYVRIKSKLSLNYEKSGSLISALSNCMENVKKIMNYASNIKPFMANGISHCIEDTTHNTKILFLPLINKLFLIEKNNLNGINNHNLEILTAEFEQLSKTNNDNNLIEVDFWLKTGDVLFLKKSDRRSFGENNRNNSLCHKQCIRDNKTDIHRLRCHRKSIQYYFKALRCCLIYFNDDKKVNVSVEISNLVNKIIKKDKNLVKTGKGKNGYKLLAQCFERIADSLISCSSLKDNIIHFKKGISALSYSFERNRLKKGTNNSTIYQYGNNVYEDIIYIYRLSSYFFMKSGEYKNSLSTLSKLGHVLIIWLQQNKINNNNKFYEGVLNAYYENIFIPSLKKIFISYDNIHFSEIQDLKEIMHKEKGNDRQITLNRLFFHSELFETLYQYIKIKLLVKKETNDLIKTIWDNYYLSAYNVHDSIYNRVLSLELKDSINNYIITDLVEKSKDSESKEIKYEVEESKYPFVYCLKVIADLLSNNKEVSFVLGSSNQNEKTSVRAENLKLLINLVNDSIRSLDEIARIHKKMGNNFFFSQRFIANVYERLSYWTQMDKALFYVLKKSEPDLDTYLTKRRLEAYGINKKEITHIINNVYELYSKLNEHKDKIINQYDELSREYKENTLSAEYQSGEALNFYYSSIEHISEGGAYKDMINSLNFFNDDLSDSNLLFNSALTCYYFNSGVIDKRISILKEQFNYSSSFEVINWVNIECDKKQTSHSSS